MTKRRLVSIGITSALLSGVLVAVSAGTAHAEYFVSNNFFCSGPYTTGKGTSRAKGNGAANRSVKHTYYVGGSQGSVTWTNVNGTYTYRTSTNHGAGNQYFTVSADYIDTANSSTGCDYVG